MYLTIADFSEMKKREKEYAEHKWMCRHLTAEGEKTSLRTALEKEREALFDLRKRVPDDMFCEREHALGGHPLKAKKMFL
uniref:Acetyl-CoA carboxytransferase n=1 Tax=Ascaris lumbricoides TaxID=6252 RepID=A0A0M3IW89_ASCLU